MRKDARSAKEWRVNNRRGDWGEGANERVLSRPLLALRASFRVASPLSERERLEQATINTKLLTLTYKRQTPDGKSGIFSVCGKNKRDA